MEKRSVRKGIQASVEQIISDALAILSLEPQTTKRKRCNKDVKKVEKEVESVDLISTLPDTVIHHILSFVRCEKEAARTSILSKKWRDTWKSFSVLTFDEQSFLKTATNPSSIFEQRMKFINFIDNSLTSHLRESSIYKVVFRITTELVPYLNQWVALAGSKGLGELDIHVVDKKRRRGSEPPTLNHLAPNLPPYNAKTLKGLRLQCINLSNLEDLNFSNLQKLYLRKLRVDPNVIQKLVSTSPLLMDLRIIECRGLKRLKISGFLKLERVELYRCPGLHRIDLEVTSLQTFWYFAKKCSHCKLYMESCKSLKKLTLQHPTLRDTFFNRLLSNFPALEILELGGCLKLKHVKISNAKLRNLELRYCDDLETVDIDIENPFSFDYIGDDMILVRGKLCLKEAKISLCPDEEDDAICFRRRNANLNWFLQNHCKDFKIIVWPHEKDIIIYDDWKSVFFPPLPDLKLHITKSSTNAEDLLDGLLTTWHPETIIVVSPRSNDVPKALKRIKRSEDPSCCDNHTTNRKCWRHFLEDATIVNVKKNRGVLDRYRDMKLEHRIDQLTGMQLHWKSSMHIDEA